MSFADIHEVEIVIGEDWGEIGFEEQAVSFADED